MGIYKEYVYQRKKDIPDELMISCRQILLYSFKPSVYDHLLGYFFP